MQTAYTSGANWSFPEDIPGGWSQDDIDTQIHGESNARRPSTAAEAPHTQQEQASANGDNTSSGQQDRYYRPRTCRICLEIVQPTFHTEEYNSVLPSLMQPKPRVTYESPVGDGGRMIRPCKCKGSQKYVHEECLGAWRRQDPTQKRNYWQCPTCLYQYRLQRLALGAWISSTFSQIGLTLAILMVTVFLLGFVADPIINFYLDPYGTVSTGGGPTGSLLYDDEAAGWMEHYVKGLASLGFLGCIKWSMQLLRLRQIVVNTRANPGGNGRDRVNTVGWVVIMVGVMTFLVAVWKGVRVWSRRALVSAGERVVDVQGNDNGDDDDYED